MIAAPVLTLLLAQAAPLPPGHPNVQPMAHGTEDERGNDPSAGNAGAGSDAVSSKELLQKLDAMKAELKDRPKSAEIEFALGNLYYENARWPDAIDAYRQLLERAKEPIDRYLALREKPHKDLSVREANCGTGDRPTYDGLVAAGDAKAKAGDVSAALVCYEAALLPIATALTRQGNAWYLIGDDDLAVVAHERALQLAPGDPDSLFFLGAILFETGDGDLAKLRKAKEAWQRFLKVNTEPDRAKLVARDLVRLQMALDNHGKLPAEMPPQMRAMSVGPIKPPGPAPQLTVEQQGELKSALAHGEAALTARRWEEAHEAFAPARRLDPGDPATARGDGVALLNLGKLQEAEAALRAALGRNPEDTQALYQLGEVYFRGEHYTGAAKFWELVVEEDPKLAAEMGLQKKLLAAQQAQ